MSEMPRGCCPHGGFGLSAGCPGDLPPRRRANGRSSTPLPAAACQQDRRGHRLRPAVHHPTAVRGATEMSPCGTARRKMRRAAEEWLGQVMADLPGSRRRAAAQPSWYGPSEVELLAALYADPEVRQVLERHGVPVAPLTGPAWQRFPAPQPLTAGPCQRPVRRLRARPDHIEPAHWQALRRGRRPSPRQRYQLRLAAVPVQDERSPFIAPAAPAPRAAAVPPRVAACGGPAAWEMMVSWR